jgi:hypothetical protein
MRLIVIAMALMLAAATPGRADSPPPTESAAPQGPYWLVVTSDRVNVRSRPDRNSLALLRIERDTVLRAEDVTFGWHRVHPPRGAFSYVSAQYVDQVSEERGIVSVATGTLRVRVGSQVADVDPLKCEVQARLTRGTEVQIIGRSGDWLKIIPPEGIHAYIHNDYVERISAERAAQLQAAAASQPPVAAAAAAEPDAPDLGGPWGQRLVLAETAIAAESRREPLEQSWTGAMAQLRPIAAQREEPLVARLAEAWIARLEQRVADQEALRVARQIAQRGDRTREQHERELEQVRRVRSDPTEPDYVARGQVLRSLALGEATEGPRFRLEDPLTRKTLAYLEFPAEGYRDAEQFLGHYVGVLGPQRHDERLGAAVIRVTRIDILALPAPATQPARQTP